MKWQDRPLTRGMWLATCVVIGLLFAGFTVLWTSAAVSSHDAKTAAARQAEGRRVAVDVTCAAMSAVIEAGRTTITGSGRVTSEEFERNLRLLGYPPKSERRAAARRAADAYARSIAMNVQRQARVKGVVRPDGTLNCARLQVAAKTKAK